MQQAWWKSGIGIDDSGLKPLCNLSQFTATNFAPSISTSIQAHLPDGYPASTENPHSASDSDSDAIDPNDLLACQNKLAKYKKHLNAIRVKLDEAKTHAILAQDHIQTLQAKINAKADKRDHNRVVHIDSRIVSTQEGREEAARQKAQREEKARKQEENQQKKNDAQAEVQAQRLREGKS